MRPGYYDDEATTAYTVLGFERIGTGGNCTAFQKELANGFYLLITRPDGASAPSDPNEAVTIGLYCDKHSEAVAEANARSAAELEILLPDLIRYARG